MDLVIDIQCCKDAKNHVVPKEVALISLQGNHLAHWIVLPPYPARRLTVQTREENKWLRQSLHGIDWDEGFTSRKVVQDQLREITKNYDKVYVRGKEKKNLLENILLNGIINLEEDDENPAFGSLPWDDSFCIFHATRMTHVAFQCAYNHVVRLKKYLLDERKKTDEQLGDITSFIQGA